MESYNITLEQGDDIQFTLVYEDANGDPIDITGAQFRMDVKKTLADTNPIWSFNTADTDVTVDPDGEGGGSPETDTGGDSLIGGTNGVITIIIDRAFSYKPAVRAGGVFLFDGVLELADGKRRKILTGTITVNKSVTLWET